jgi:type 1 fimbria pilin
MRTRRAIRSPGTTQTHIRGNSFSANPNGLVNPVKLNNDSASGTLHFLPALRNADANGNLNVSWYDRRLSPSSALTDVFAALGVNPRTTGTPEFNTRVTNVSSNWLVVSSDITPNFGDYPTTRRKSGP